jgi:hypothetical protein
MNATEQLDQLESWLGRAVGDAYAAALEVPEPAGMTPAWRAVLDNAGVSPAPDEDRRRAATATKMLRGAPVDELYEVLDKLKKDAGKRLEKIEFPDDNAGQRRWRRLQGVIDGMRDETVAAYRKQVMPKKTGGMFAAALASAKAKQGVAAAPQRTGEAFVMRCEKCGAPRLKNDDFVCEYCDTPYAPDGQSPLEG